MRPTEAHPLQSVQAASIRTRAVQAGGALVCDSE
ncbi:unnamed protein product, partial [marine sediment metagenome]